MNRDSKGAPQLPPSEKPDSLANSAKKNPSALGDPVSLKNESSDSSPTEHDKGSGPKEAKDNSKDHETLSQKALKNPSALGDPVSIKAEQSTLVPTDEARGAKQDGKDSKL